MNPETNLPVSSMTDLVKPKKYTGLIVGIILGVLMILGGGGAAAYAAMQGWIALPYNLFAPKPPTMQEIEKAILGITSGTMTLSMDYTAQAKTDGTVIIPKFPEITKVSSTEMTTTETSELALSLKEAATDKYSQMFMDAKLGLTAQASFKSGEEKDTQGNLKFTYQNSGMSLTFDSDYVYKEESFYLKLNAFPLPILDFSTLTGKWIHLTKKSADPSILYGMGNDDEVTIWESTATSTENESVTSTDNLAQPAIDSQKEFTLIRDQLISKQALAIQSSQLITDTKGRRVWHLTLRLDPEKTIEALNVAFDQRPAQEKYAILTDDFKTQIQNPEFKTWLATAMSAVTSEIDLDSKTFVPLQQVFHLRYATEASQKLATPKEFLVNISYQLDRVNQPITVEVPTDTIEPKKALQLLMGRTDDDVKFANQTSLITELRSALGYYKQEHQQYPDSLNQLIGLNSPYDFMPERVVKIPNDLYTNQPFVYAVSADKKDFTLKYQLKFTDGPESEYLKDTYINGENTADVYSLSQEIDRTKDSDSDGLTDAEERIHKTSIYRADTDGDGFTDKQEIDGGYDPLINSKTKKAY